jgi:hypothetical protein
LRKIYLQAFFFVHFHTSPYPPQSQSPTSLHTFTVPTHQKRHWYFQSRYSILQRQSLFHPYHFFLQTKCTTILQQILSHM